VPSGEIYFKSTVDVQFQWRYHEWRCVIGWQTFYVRKKSETTTLM